MLIQKEMFLEMVDLNQKFGDHYTASAVLVGVYLKLEFDHDRNIMAITEEKRKIGLLMAYSLFDTLSSVNFGKFSKLWGLRENLCNSLRIIKNASF